MVKKAILLLLVAAFPLEGRAQNRQDPEALLVTLKAVEKARNDDKIKRETLVFKKTHRIDNLDSEAKFKSLEQIETYKIYSNKSHPIEELIDIQPPDANKGGPPLDFNYLLDALLSRYYFLLHKKVDGTPLVEDVDGHQCYQISFWPKENPEYTGRNEDEVINRATGIFYIDESNSMLWKLDSSLSNSFSKSIFFNMEQFDLHLEMMDLRGTEVIKTAEVVAKYSYRSLSSLFFSKVNRYQKHTYIYDYNAYKK